MKLLFAHGWGFDRQVWTPLLALLPESQHAFDDRPYFDPPANAQGSPPGARPSPLIAVTHSFGTMRVLADPPAGLAGIVAINGFARFTGEAAVPVRVVDRMLRRFAGDPRAVLAEFRRTCGCDDRFGAIAPEPLHADLLRLRDERAPPATVPVAMLHGANDPILPPAMRAAATAVHPRGGHLLPLEDPEFCARAVRDLAARLA